MDKSGYDPNLIERRTRLRKKRHRKSCLSQLMLILFLLSIAVALYFAWVVSKRDQPYTKSSESEKTLWFAQTSEVLFSTPTPSLTSSFTPTVPSPTPTPTSTATKTITATVTCTSTPLLQRKTSTPVLPSSTPLLQLNAAETEIIGAYEATAAVSPTAAATPDMWFEMMGNPGAINANLIYANAGCSWMGVGGFINDSRGDPIIGIHIQIGGFADEEIREALSGQFPVYGESGYEITIARPVQNFTNPLWIQLLNDSLVPISEKTYFKPSGSCDKSLILINFKKIK